MSRDRHKLGTRPASRHTEKGSPGTFSLRRGKERKGGRPREKFYDSCHGKGTGDRDGYSWKSTALNLARTGSEGKTGGAGEYVEDAGGDSGKRGRSGRGGENNERVVCEKGNKTGCGGARKRVLDPRVFYSTTRGSTGTVPQED